MNIIIKLQAVGRVQVRPHGDPVHRVVAGMVVVAEEGGGVGRQLQVVVVLGPGRDVRDGPVGEG